MQIYCYCKKFGKPLNLEASKLLNLVKLKPVKW